MSRQSSPPNSARQPDPADAEDNASDEAAHEASLNANESISDYLWDGSGSSDAFVAELETALTPLRYQGELSDETLDEAFAAMAGDGLHDATEIDEQTSANATDATSADAAEAEIVALAPEAAAPAMDEPKEVALVAVDALPQANQRAANAPRWLWLAAAAVLGLMGSWVLRNDDAPLTMYGDVAVRTQQLQKQIASAVIAMDAGWQIEAVTGEPVSDGAPLEAGTKLRLGVWMQTDDNSTARLEVPGLGVVEVAAATRLRIVVSHSKQHRIELSRGSIHASVDAPARNFIVDTPLATVVDLGCAYTIRLEKSALKVDVWTGAVALDSPRNRKRRQRVFVPEGASCDVRADAIGVPRFRGATTALTETLARFNAGETGELPEVLAASTSDDALTLWHLYARFDGAAQQTIAARMETLGVALPANVTRAEVRSGTVPAQRWWPDLRKRLPKSQDDRNAPQQPTAIAPPVAPPVAPVPTAEPSPPGITMENIGTASPRSRLGPPPKDPAGDRYEEPAAAEKKATPDEEDGSSQKKLAPKKKDVPDQKAVPKNDTDKRGSYGKLRRSWDAPSKSPSGSSSIRQ